jgi:hypothetical protein
MKSVRFFTRVWFFIYYYFFSWFYEYKEHVKIKTIMIVYEDNEYTHDTLKRLTLTEMGVFFSNIEENIPYEYIFSVLKKGSITGLSIFAKVENNELKRCDDQTNIYIDTDDYFLGDRILNNMSYYIMYKKRMINKEIYSFKLKKDV